MARYRWNPRLGGTGRYVDTNTGRILPNARVRVELDKTLDNATDPVDALATQLREGQISLVDWELQMREQIKSTHLTSIAAQRGGWENMTPSDYGRAGQIIRDQYGYLDGFAKDIASGDQPLDGNITRRSRLYIYAGRDSYNASARAAALRNGLTQIRSKLRPAEHCRECVQFDGVWYDIGDPAYKPPGNRICNKNCRCLEQYGHEGKVVAEGAVLDQVLEEIA